MSICRSLSVSMNVKIIPLLLLVPLTAVTYWNDFLGLKLKPNWSTVVKFKNKLGVLLYDLGLKKASISPLLSWESLRNITGPLSITVVTASVDSTMKKTEQKARLKWHLCLLTSRFWYIIKKDADDHQSIDLSSASCENDACENDYLLWFTIVLSDMIDSFRAVVIRPLLLTCLSVSSIFIKSD